MSEDKTDAEVLTDLRRQLGLTQAEMADAIGMKLRAYSDLEKGVSAVRPVHLQSAERAALRLAIERGDPMLAPESVRRQALALARLLGT